MSQIELNEQEIANLTKFRKKHLGCSNKDLCYNNPSFAITSIPTNIGHRTEVECKTCNSIEDITDYESW